MTLLRRHPVLTLGFALALALTLFFAGRFVAQVVYWSDPARQEQDVEGWMTLRYVAKSWSLPARDLYDAAGLPVGERGQRQTLEQLAQKRGVPVAQVIAEVEAGIALLTGRAPGPDAADRVPLP